MQSPATPALNTAFHCENPQLAAALWNRRWKAWRPTCACSPAIPAPCCRRAACTRASGWNAARTRARCMANTIPKSPATTTKSFGISRGKTDLSRPSPRNAGRRPIANRGAAGANGAGMRAKGWGRNRCSRADTRPARATTPGWANTAITAARAWWNCTANGIPGTTTARATRGSSSTVRDTMPASAIPCRGCRSSRRIFRPQNT